ncbi:MAG: TraR/DksA C4-type zinc finger protein [Xanthomonadaceae bacterium]|nr:TraR/DksA C4-type zinc finger protein [Xanthomonadaceae bacterium]MDP2185037.1 TraR/DksA C4-type zinc finger protein [Xanthomonadales bacterium]MDZ4114416.1 TraR/DksA C4-type zinc finger protein [Xanthomonadaceae bacterium]
MADFADIASALEEQQRDAALAAQRAASDRRARIAESMRGYDPALPRACVDCGDTIPLERLRIYPMTGRCTGCSAEAEKRLSARHG